MCKNTHDAKININDDKLIVSNNDLEFFVALMMYLCSKKWPLLPIIYIARSERGVVFWLLLSLKLIGC